MTLTRRSFIKTSTALAAGLAAPTYLKASMRSASDRVNVALIGCRSMGWGDLMNILSLGNVHCLALCDIDQSVLDSKAKSWHPGRRPSSSSTPITGGCSTAKISARDYRHPRSLALPSIRWRARRAKTYVEKPIANSIAECDVMVEAANKYGSVVQVGQQQRSATLWKELVDYLNTGALGEVSRIHVYCNFNYGAIKERVPDSEVPGLISTGGWGTKQKFQPAALSRCVEDVLGLRGGLMTDWGVHLLDVALWVKQPANLPLTVQASGGNYLFPDGMHETFDTQSVLYRFDDYLLSWEHNAASSRIPTEKITAWSHGKMVRSWPIGTIGRSTPKRRRYPRKSLRRTTAKPEHAANFLDCIKRRDRNTACTIEMGSLSAKYAHLGNIAARMDGASLHFDDERKTFNIPEADRFIKPVYRAPWKFPEV